MYTILLNFKTRVPLQLFFFKEKKWSMRLLLFIFLLFPPLKQIAQVTKVYGTVVDAKTKDPLTFVNLIFKGSRTGTSTGISGSYSFYSVNPSDSIVVSSVGYKKQTIAIQPRTTQRINIELQRNNQTLPEVVIRKGKNPALKIMDSVLAHKDENSVQALKRYEWERYDKFQMYFGKYADRIKELRPFREYSYVFKNTDSINGQALLPIYMSETIQKEFMDDSLSLDEAIVLARKSTGENYENLTTMTDRLLENKNIYSDYYQLLDKSFVSPLIDNYQLFYNYERDENVVIGKKTFYKIDFEPKWKEDLTFFGTLIIDPQTWAVRRINLKVAPSINLNYVKSLSITQEFQLVEKKWIMHRLETWVTLSALKWQKGEDITVHRFTSFKDIQLSGNIKQHYFKVLGDAPKDQEQQSEAFWKTRRHIPLGKREKYNYTIADTINHVPFIRRVKRIGTILISGYMELGKISLFQANTFYSKNPIENNRFKFGLITNKYFSTSLQLSGYAAYGSRDKELKYKAGLLYVMTRGEDRAMIGASYRYDLEQLGVSTSHIAFDNVITLFSKINQKVKLTFAREASFHVEKEWARKGVISRITFLNKEIRPLGSIHFEKQITDNQVEKIHDVTTSEIRLNGRFSFRERFYVNEFKRIPLGSRYPIFIIDFTAGIKNIIGSDYNYQKLKTIIQGKLHVNPVGYFYYNLEGGKIFGSVPFVLCVLHPANQSLAYDVEGFNVMNYFEFASDRYISLYLDHHWDGFFLNKIPFIQKAKLREVISARGVIGDLSEQNKHAMILPEGMSSVNKPYVEYSVGIENIFKVLRIDYIWRGTHLDVPRSDTWAVKARFMLTF